MRISILCFFFSFCILYANAQKVYHYDLAELSAKNKLQGDTATKINILNDKDHSGAITLAGYVWLKDVSFSKGTIDVDLRGKNAFLKSFLGIAFHGINDNTYDVVYFRPFNFKNEDTMRRKWSVQYMSMPDYDYDKLRKAHPLVYENAVIPVPDPDDWFHATIVVTDDSVKVYVDHSSTASLKTKLLGNQSGAKIALWSYIPGVSGDFANLVIKKQ
jgi:hypothetical protein